MDEDINLTAESIEWEAPEFLYRHKTVFWYWISAIIAVIIFAFAWWQKNIFFGVFIVLAEILLIYFAGQRPRSLKFSAGPTGIAIGDEKHYSYDSLESFWVRQKNNEFSELIVKTTARLNPRLKILIDEKSAVSVRKILSKYLPEEEYEETLLDSFSELAGF
mgnify:CR=1 FL=1